MNNQKKNTRKISKDHRILAKNTFYSFLFSYGKFLFALISSFIIARIISPETWGFLILTLSIVNMFSFFMLFLPPSLGLSFHYYIPRYRALNQNSKIKSLVLNSLIMRLVFLIPIFFLSLLVFNIFFTFFKISLQNYTHLFYILSPLIAINSFDKTFNDLSRALNKFQVVFMLLVVKYVVNIGGLILLFLFIEIIEVEMIAVIALLSSLIPFIINIIYILYILHKIDKTEEEVLTFKETFKLLYKYGSILTLNTFIDSFYTEFTIQSIGFSIDTEFVTGFNLARHYRDVSSEAVRSLNRPLTISFSELYSVKRFNQIERIFKVVFSYSLFLLLLLTGLLFFVVEFFLSIVYGESYLKFSLIVKLMLISTIFSLPGGFFFSLLKVSDKIKYLTPISIIFYSIQILLFLLGLIFYGIEGSIIGMIIAGMLIFISLIFLIKKLYKIKLHYRKHISPYLIFFISIGITLILENLFLSEFNSLVLESLNLHLIKHFKFSSIIVFVFFYLLLIILLKVFTSEDIENLELFFNKDNFLHKLIRKGLKLLKRIIWD